MIRPPPRSTLFPSTTLFRSPMRILLSSILLVASSIPAISQSVKPPAERVAQQNALRSEEHTSELQSQSNLVCRLLLEKKKYSFISDGHLSLYISCKCYVACN